MDLKDVTELELYVDREVEEKDGEVNIKRIKLDGDLEIGEEGYFRTGYRNKVIKQDENEYIFYRFDEIQSHIEEYESRYTFDDVRSKIANKLDYEIDYAEDRVGLVKELIENNEWIYDLISSNGLIMQKQKSKKDFLAEEQQLEQVIDRISSYICHAKFKNEEDHNKYEELKNKRREFRKRRQLNKTQLKEHKKTAESLVQYDNRIAPNHLSRDTATKEEDKEKENKLMNNQVFDSSKSQEVVRKRFKNPIKKFDVTFWDRMGYTEEMKIFRNEIINIYEQELKALSDQLGIGKPTEERIKIQNDLLKKMETKIFKHNNKRSIYTPKRQLMVLNSIYREIKGDYNDALKTLTDQINFTSMIDGTTEYNWNQDTYIVDSEGIEREISKNMLTMSDPNTYKGLLLTYYELNDRYRDRMHDDMWAILKDFENILDSAELDEIERLICHLLMNDFEVKEIGKIIRTMDSKMLNRRIYRMIDTIIPNKLKDEYVNSVREWTYTNVLVGKWKKCSKCNETKLIVDTSYFNKDNRNKDGFKSVCKKCNNYT